MKASRLSASKALVGSSARIRPGWPIKSARGRHPLLLAHGEVGGALGPDLGRIKTQPLEQAAGLRL
jgi:hypothetical protein